MTLRAYSHFAIDEVPYDQELFTKTMPERLSKIRDKAGIVGTTEEVHITWCRD